MAIEDAQPPARTAGEVGWHVSQYIISAPVPGTDNVAIANLFKGTCAEYTPLDLKVNQWGDSPLIQSESTGSLPIDSLSARMSSKPKRFRLGVTTELSSCRPAQLHHGMHIFLGI